MKLLDKYNQVNLVAIVIIMLITGAIYYQTISLILTNQKDQSLEVEEQEVFNYVKRNHSLPQVFESQDQQISFSPIDKDSAIRQFINTTYFKSKNNPESGRGLISFVDVGNKTYQILIVESKVETEDLIQIIFGITIGVILLLLLVLVFINRLILNRLWQPFYTILGELKLFDVADKRIFPALQNTTDEFNELHQEVSAMSIRVKNDYTNLKNFTENASHELMTPIAIINSKLDTLIQNQKFDERDSKLLTELYDAVNRLNRLNKSMLLLVKVENKLLKETSEVSLHHLTEEVISQFEEIFESKNLKVITSFNERKIVANPQLIEILLNNLISNAIRHNHTGGEIAINISSERMSIKNTGNGTGLESTEIFNRFHKSNESEGSGLGLTIARQICENFDLKIAYSYQHPYHSFDIIW